VLKAQLLRFGIVRIMLLAVFVAQTFASLGRRSSGQAAFRFMSREFLRAVEITSTPAAAKFVCARRSFPARDGVIGVVTKRAIDGFRTRA